MHDKAKMRLRMADFVRLRSEHAVAGKDHLVTYIDQLIAEMEARIALAEPDAPNPGAS